MADETADDVIQRCRGVGAVYGGSRLETPEFVVILRDDIGPELWTETALRRSMRR